MSRRGDDDDEVAEDKDDFFGLASLDGIPDDPQGDFLLLLGMQVEEDHPLVKFNAELDARKRLKRCQDSDTIISEIKSFIKKRKCLPRAFPGTWYKRNNRWLVLRDGILFRKSYSETIHADVLQAIIPSYDGGSSRIANAAGR